MKLKTSWTPGPSKKRILDQMDTAVKAAIKPYRGQPGCAAMCYDHLALVDQNVCYWYTPPTYTESPRNNKCWQILMAPYVPTNTVDKNTQISKVICENL